MGEGFVVLQSQVCQIEYLQDEPGTNIIKYSNLFINELFCFTCSEFRNVVHSYDLVLLAGVFKNSQFCMYTVL